MFGGFRFILAAFVALSHLGIVLGGFNQGNEAVICFYTLSGLLMERQFRKLSVSGNGMRAFYLDRFLRIYPLYLAVLALASLSTRISWRAAVANAALVPLDYSTFTGVPSLIPIAWSVALEMHFYILVPFFALRSTKTLRLICLGSILFFAISPWLPCSTFWAYTGLPGMLFTFLTGMLINRKDFPFIRALAIIAALLLVVFGLTKLFHTGLLTGIHINVCIGYLAALIAIPALDRFSQKSQWDRGLGLFSYPLFLCHGLVFAFCSHYFAISKAGALLCASILFTAVLILIVELPFDYIRYMVRAPANTHPSDHHANA